MTNANPLHLPEIQTHLGQFLSKKSILSCILVCREWHDAFYPSLWLDGRSHQSFDSKDLPPELILKNSHYIRRFTLNCMVHPQLEDMHLSQLRRVIIFAMTPAHRGLAIWSEKFLLRHRTTLVSMNVLLNIQSPHYVSDVDGAQDRATTMVPGWHVFKELYRLQHLFLMDGRVHSWDDCWQTWCRLNFLGLKGGSFEPTVRSIFINSENKIVPHPWVPPFAQIRSAGLHLRNNVRSLELWSLLNITSTDQLDLILCFPKLERLAWTVRSSSGKLPLEEFAIAIADEGCCPLLTNVELDDGGQTQDEDLAKLLRAMKVIEGVQLTKKGFGPLCMQVLLGEEAEVKEQTVPKEPSDGSNNDDVAAEEVETAPLLPTRLDKEFLKNQMHHIKVLRYDIGSNAEEERSGLPEEQSTPTAAVPVTATGSDDAKNGAEHHLARKSHAATLKFFKMAQCPTVTSDMLHRILCSCPNLKEFTGAVIRDSDMFTEAILPSDEFRPWSCVKLKKLKCFFEVQDETRNRQVLQALGSLRQLDIFKAEFSHEQLAVKANQLHGLTFCLQTGLDELRSLKQLTQWWSGGQSRQDMGEKDVDWIADNLQNLTYFHARTTMDYHKGLELKKRLASRGIRAP